MAAKLLAAALCLLAVLAAPAAARTGPEPGPFVGTVAQGEADSHHFSTHGDQPCLAVWIPKLYVVTLAYAPPTDTLALSAAGASDAGANGVAAVSFVANYCTAFTIRVAGTAVADEAAYVVTVESVFLGAEPVLA